MEVAAVERVIPPACPFRSRMPTVERAFACHRPLRGPDPEPRRRLASPVRESMERGGGGRAALSSSPSPVMNTQTDVLLALGRQGSSSVCFLELPLLAAADIGAAPGQIATSRAALRPTSAESCSGASRPRPARPSSTSSSIAFWPNVCGALPPDLLNIIES
jgi:hypothetical protein